MKHLFSALVFLAACNVAAPEAAANNMPTPAPSGRVKTKTNWLGRHLKKRRPPVLPYERALRRNELFRS